VSFISPAAHQKFILQCQHLIQDAAGVAADDMRTESLKADLAQLQRLVEVYSKTLSQLPGLAREYKELQRRIRIRARRMQPVKNTNGDKR